MPYLLPWPALALRRCNGSPPLQSCPCLCLYFCPYSPSRFPLPLQVPLTQCLRSWPCKVPNNLPRFCVIHSAQNEGARCAQFECIPRHFQLMPLCHCQVLHCPIAFCCPDLIQLSPSLYHTVCELSSVFFPSQNPYSTPTRANAHMPKGVYVVDSTAGRGTGQGRTGGYVLGVLVD